LPAYRSRRPAARGLRLPKHASFRWRPPTIPLVADHSRGVSFMKIKSRKWEDRVMLRRIGSVALAIFGLFAFTAAGSAQKHPSRTVTIIVPYPAGGPTDETTRIVANFLSKKLGQNFIVENVTGGSTIIATGRVANAAPDGYTLLMHNLQITANVTLIKN